MRTIFEIRRGVCGASVTPNRAAACVCGSGFPPHGGAVNREDA